MPEYRAESPPRIAAVEPDPRHPHAVRVRVAGSLYCTIARSVAEAEGLAPGRLIDPELHQRLGRAADVEAAYRSVIRALSQRAYARRALERRLIAKGQPRVAVAAALDRAEDAGLLNDAAFAVHFVQTRAARGRGPGRLVHDLLARGVARPLIDRAIAEQWPDGVDPDDAPRKLALRRAQQLDGLPRPVRRRRGPAYLARRGYGGCEIPTMVDRVLDGR
jgi:regulatory protein